MQSDGRFFFGFSSRNLNHYVWKRVYPLSFPLFARSRIMEIIVENVVLLPAESMIGPVRDSDAGKRHTLRFKL